jgi:histidine ammonia-lyase
VATLSPDARAAMQRSADLVEGFVSGEQPVYGVTTGFGSRARTGIPADRTAEPARLSTPSWACIESQLKRDAPRPCLTGRIGTGLRRRPDR